jgi:hypothetical protein
MKKESIFCGVLRYDKNLPKKWEFFASEIDEERCDDPSHKNRKIEYFAGRAALFLSSQFLEIEGKIEVDSEFGFLKWKNISEKSSQIRSVSLSHSRGLVAVVFSSSPVGIDLEPVDRKVDVALSRWGKNTDFKKDFYEIESHPVSFNLMQWCAYESVAKASGLGLGRGYKPFEIDFSEKGILPVKVLESNPQNFREGFVRFFYFEDYLIALCVQDRHSAEQARIHCLN